MLVGVELINCPELSPLDAAGGTKLSRRGKVKPAGEGLPLRSPTPSLGRLLGGEGYPCSGDLSGLAKAKLPVRPPGEGAVFMPWRTALKEAVDEMLFRRVLRVGELRELMESD